MNYEQNSQTEKWTCRYSHGNDVGASAILLLETKLPSVIQVPYSSTFVKITTVHMRITFASKVFFF